MPHAKPRPLTYVEANRPTEIVRVGYEMGRRSPYFNSDLAWCTTHSISYYTQRPNDKSRRVIGKCPLCYRERHPIRYRGHPKSNAVDKVPVLA